LHIKSHSGHPLNDFADDLAKRGADGEECYEGLYECIVKINTGNSRIRFGGSKPLADRYPELLSERNDVYGRVVGMDGRNTYLVQWYVQNAQKGCIYSHEGSEIVKLGDGLEAATRWSFSEEIRIGYEAGISSGKSCPQQAAVGARAPNGALELTSHRGTV
jgi:hypothetical protein